MQPSCRREKPAQEEIQKLLFRTGLHATRCALWIERSKTLCISPRICGNRCVYTPRYQQLLQVVAGKPITPGKFSTIFCGSMLTHTLGTAPLISRM